jgi:hypothetical protein
LEEGWLAPTWGIVDEICHALRNRPANSVIGFPPASAPPPARPLRRAATESNGLGLFDGVMDAEQFYEPPFTVVATLDAVRATAIAP